MVTGCANCAMTRRAPCPPDIIPPARNLIALQAFFPTLATGWDSMTEPAHLKALFPGAGIMSRILRQHDWHASALGDPADWPEALKIALRMMLTSRFEMWLGWGPDLAFFYNDAYIPTLGLKHPQALARPFREVWAEVYGDVADQVERVRQGGSTWNAALLLLLERSGYREETYHSFSYSPLFGASGQVDGMLCVVSEETERVISERRLEMLRSLGAALVGTSDRKGAVAAVSSVFGAARHDFPFALIYFADEGATAGHACTPDAQALVDHRWPFAQVDGTLTCPLPQDMAVPTGAWDRPADAAFIVAIPGASGQPPAGYLVLGLNPYRNRDSSVDDLVQTIAGQIGGSLASVAALDRERQRADRLWAHSRDLMVSSDASGVLQSVNPAWTRILGHRLDDVIGHNFAEFVVAEDADHTADGLARTIAETELTGFENRYRTIDGGFRWISWNTTFENGLAYAYGRDITEQKANEAALTAAEDALRQAQKMEAVGQLTGGIAHDFNNLLTGIIGSLELMQRRVAQGRTHGIERYATAAIASAHRAAALTQRLLAFSRRQPLDPRPLDANTLMRGMEDMVRRTIGEAIALEVVVAGGLWPTICDPNQLESAVLNLVINARDAMPGGGRLTIETANASIDDSYALRNRYAVPGQYVMLSVTDTGHGMSADIISKAFEPFFTTKPIGQGTGLGLSMIYGFARQSEGFANIYSEEGRGTTVRLYLPRHFGDLASDPIEELHAAITLRLDAPATVLVVEDEPVVRNLVVDVLREQGLGVVEAQDGPAGLEIVLSERKIDLLITDVGLPGLNGRQLADAAREKRPDLKVLFLTGYAHNAVIGNAMLEPGMEIVTKPFAVESLASRIAGMLDTL
jgi:PAS domain S-box-containing protein